MDFRDFLVAFTQDWVTLMSGIASVALTIIGVAKKWEKVPDWAFWLAAAACFLFAAVRIWTTEHRARLQLETVRPYMLIEELSPAQIKAIAIRNSKNVLPEGAYDRGYVSAVSSNHEYLLYDFRNAGRVPARNVLHYQRATAIGGGSEEEIQFSPSQTQREVLIPDQSSMYQLEVPRGTFITNIPNESRSIRIQLLITFTGQPSDRNTYFYKVVLVARRYSDVEEMNRYFGNIRTESTDEGVVNSLGDLLR